MFGIAVARMDQIDEIEKRRYQELYCGLCLALKNRYGNISRISLNYDLTFLIMLLDSLYEPTEDLGQAGCIMHPTKKVPYSISPFSDYAADVSVALAFHKCLDDVEDDDSILAKGATKLLSPSYRACSERIPFICEEIESRMQNIRMIESSTTASPDDAANEFGYLLAKVFSPGSDAIGSSLCRMDGTWDRWDRTLYDLGFSLGRFIYLMDAAVDLESDTKNGSYNPFKKMDLSVDAIRAILTNIIGEASEQFEKLPLIQDEHLLSSILYSGVWQKFNHTYEKYADNAS